MDIMRLWSTKDSHHNTQKIKELQRFLNKNEAAMYCRDFLMYKLSQLFLLLFDLSGMSAALFVQYSQSSLCCFLFYNTF